MARIDIRSRWGEFRRRVNELSQRVRASGSDSQLQQALDELKRSAAELSALQEQLAETNRGLAEARRSAEQEKQRYRNLFDAAPDAYIVTDRRGAIIEVNETAAGMLNLDKFSLKGKSLAIFIDRECFTSFLVEVSAAMRSGHRHFETRVHRRGKCCVDVLANVTASGDKKSLLWLIRNITERKQNEAEIRGNERLATVGATAMLLARDISNPLNSIFTSVQRLERIALPDPADGEPFLRATINELAHEGGRLRGLLQKFCSFSRLSALHLGRTDLCLIASDILGTEETDYGACGIRVEQSFSRPLYVRADYEKLKQALVHLCRNAVEAMPRGGTLGLRGYTLNHHVIFEVSDTGVGVPAGIDVFDLFTTTKFQALGMGLPIARHIVVDHGGGLSFTSAPGSTVFRVALPANA